MRFDYLILAALALAACSKPTTTSQPSRGSVAQPIRFDTEAAAGDQSVPAPPIQGRVTTVDALTARSFAPLGGRVVEQRVRLGDRVKKGDKLVRIQTAELAGLMREKSLAGVEVSTKQNVLKRLEQLHELRAASDNDVLLAESELEQAKLRGKASSAMLGSLAVTPADATSFWVVAPRAGTIVAFSATAGSEVGPSAGEPLAVVSDLDSVLVVAQVPPVEAAALQLGGSAEVRSSGADTGVKATIEAVAEVVDPETQTVPVRLRVANSQRQLKPNGYVEIVFKAGGDAQVLSVRSEAVVSDGAQAVVFVETSPGELEKRSVRLGRQGRQRTEILEGLRLGEQVVTTGALLLLNALDVKG